MDSEAVSSGQMTESPQPSMRGQLVIFGITRTILNTGFRMVYPFLPAMSRGLGVELGVVALAITARSFLGLASPLLGSIADLRGRKQSMLLGLGLFILGFMTITIWPTLTGLFFALLISAGGKIIFDTSIQAYLGDTVQYKTRGRAIALTELGWSGAALIGLPIIGWIIARSNWLVPFPFLASLGALSLIILAGVLPSYELDSSPQSTLLSRMNDVFTHRPALAGVVVGLLISAANEVVTIVYGAWMEEAFQVNVVALGAASAVFGLAELSGEGLVARFSDRLGKRVAIGIGILSNTLACLLLPLLGQSVNGALIGLFLFYLSFEFTIVSSIPLMTEMVPRARATTMAGFIAGVAAGRGIGALLGPTLFGSGIIANFSASAALNLLAFLALMRFIPETD
jgi:predicted MFS family arabinose efflux permease